MIDPTCLKNALSRRTFLAGAGSVAAAAALVGCADDGTTTMAGTTTFTDADILNFALNLEYLEAEFYLRAATGSGLATADIGATAGTVTGGAKVTGLTTAQQNILNEIAYDEQQHVRFLRSALRFSGCLPPQHRPHLLRSARCRRRHHHRGNRHGSFNPFTSGFDGFLVGAFIFEDVGVTAYNGAAPLISTAGITAGYLAAAAGIMAVEAYHAAYVRTYLTAQAIAQGATAYPYFGYANQVSALRATLGGGNETPLTLPSGAHHTARPS